MSHDEMKLVELIWEKEPIRSGDIVILCTENQTVRLQYS